MTLDSDEGKSLDVTEELVGALQSGKIDKAQAQTLIEQGTSFIESPAIWPHLIGALKTVDARLGLARTVWGAVPGALQMSVCGNSELVNQAVNIGFLPRKKVFGKGDLSNEELTGRESLKLNVLKYVTKILALVKPEVKEIQPLLEVLFMVGKENIRLSARIRGELEKARSERTAESEEQIRDAA